MQNRSKKIGRKSEQGFSFLELITVVGIIGILSAFAVMSTRSITFNSKANAAMDAVITQLRAGRQMAISMRRNVLVQITTPNKIQLTVETLPGEAPATPIAPVYLNDNSGGGAQFYVYPGLPDTPMAFGNSQAINYVASSGGTAGLSVMFSTSGTLVGTTLSSGFSTVGNSNPVNASIFLAIPGQQNSARAITVLGATGRVRSYFWTGSSWQE
jgi:prepilin-type N-terminal cleavage/methylation domain-containing protein